jgi:glutathione synthase/RimK-type ligase-like ATP-grasp enzyme
MRRFMDDGFYVCTVSRSDYLGAGKFSKHFFPTDFSKMNYEERGDVTVDFLYDRAELYPNDMPYMNNQEIGQIANDKKKTYELFSDLQPKTVFAEGVELPDLSEVVGENGKIVVKPYHESGGKGILVGGVEELSSRLPNPPFLVQEFIETSGGVAGIASGRHDVRVFVMGGNVVGGLVRQPLGDNYLSNTKQGGSMRVLSESELPDDVKTMALTVDSRLSKLPRFYSADFFFSSLHQRWFLIELNGAPGLLPDSYGEVGHKLQQALAMELLKVIELS